MPREFTPQVTISLHGFKSHGKWQQKFSEVMSDANIHICNYNYGYKFLSALIPGFKNKLIEKFYEHYTITISNKKHDIDLNNPFKRPSIVAHSLGSYILCHSMLKYPDIKFDKIILCGSIVEADFDWGKLIARDQVHFIRNEFSTKDDIVKWGFVLSKGNSYSGWYGFNDKSDYIEQENYEQYNHSNFFDGNHMLAHWVPFLKKYPIDFVTIVGREISTINSYSKLLSQTREIDNLVYGSDEYWEDFSIPKGLSRKWITVNSDIYTFLIKGKKVIGYLNAMPLKSEVFNKLLDGSVHDNHITSKDILAYDYTTQEIDLYIMSIAIHPNYQAMHLGLKDLGFYKLNCSLYDKCIHYYTNKGIKIRRIAAIGWTDKGIKLCKIFGLEPTGKHEDITKKPIFLLDIRNNNRTTSSRHNSIKSLINHYKS